MTAPIVMVTQDRPASPAELANAAEIIAEGYLDGTGNSRHTKGTLWERAAEREPSGTYPRPVKYPRGRPIRRLGGVIAAHAAAGIIKAGARVR